MEKEKYICPICGNDTHKINGIYRNDKLCITHQNLFMIKETESLNKKGTYEKEYLPDIKFENCIICNSKSNGYAYCKDCILILSDDERFDILKNYIYFDPRNIKTINKLQILRNKKQLSIQEVAKELKLKKEEYEKYEQGIKSLTLEIAIKLAELYQVSIDFLIGRPIDYNIVETKYNSLTDNEYRLIELFRYLDASTQDLVIGFIQAKLS